MPRITDYLSAIRRSRIARAWVFYGICALVVIASVGLLVQCYATHEREKMYRISAKGGLIGRVFHANLLAEQGDYAGAANAFEEIAQDYVDTDIGAEAMIWTAGMWQAAHEHAKAIGVYERVIREYPKSPWRHGAEFGLRNMLTAGKREPRKNEPIASEFRAATRLQSLGKYGDAATRFEDLARSYPKHELAPFALLEAGNCYFLNSQPEDAEKRWRQVIERYPNSTWKADADFALRALQNPTLRGSLCKILAQE